ncbi:glycosyltransferase family 2 protein [Hydrogenovibrio kuenenii]|uniref:glycosyltransferase family 2 protein n=1 Tax=Hydrogenovibrio kuenenii TaxID=63658 RepID=UPI000465611E|nr:glycosyltransferase family 2 protein [Hydrogenovibrio kuenenii]
MRLSIVATLYCSSSYIAEFCSRVKDTATKLVDDDYEIILVNDGSPDNSLEIAVEMSKNDGHIRVVDLSRNFGHHKAMMTGLMHATGQKVFLIDSDLEEEPEWLLVFDEILQAEDCDVVYGVQKQRKGNFFEQWGGKIFYKLFNFLTGLQLPTKGITTARLMKRAYVKALVQHQERTISIGGLFQITGFQQRAEEVVKHSRSESTYTLRKKMALAIDSIASFSNLPLLMVFYLGLIVSFIALVIIVYFIALWLFFDNPVQGWTSLIASIWLLGGMIISSIGMLGIYLSKMFIEVKQRPYTIVRRIFVHGKAIDFLEE